VLLVRQAGSFFWFPLALPLPTSCSVHVGFSFFVWCPFPLVAVWQLIQSRMRDRIESCFLGFRVPKRDPKANQPESGKDTKKGNKHSSKAEEGNLAPLQIVRRSPTCFEEPGLQVFRVPVRSASCELDTSLGRRRTDGRPKTDANRENAGGSDWSHGQVESPFLCTATA
jgi:hypothetical protein